MDRLGLCIILLTSFTTAGIAAASDQANPDAPVLFERDVYPILKTHCFQCHGEAGKKKASLDLRLRRYIVKGGDDGPAIVPGKRKESLLYTMVLKAKMPRADLKLTKSQIETIGRWIDRGAKTANPEPEQLDNGLRVTEHERSYWAFQPVKRPEPPTFKGSGAGPNAGSDIKRLRTPIDRFILTKLREKKLSFSPKADKTTLIRRATFDLTGLPPTPKDVDAFLADDRPDAYGHLIDRLLASPRYGERWGRHWLDVTGYADSEGYTDKDVVRPHAWKYRDYVIRAFNSDKPADLFIRQQLAGDEMLSPPYRNLTAEAAENLIATGFLRMAPDGTGSGAADQNLARNQVMADSIEIVSTALLGLTVGCARCHDHRYDPIAQVDYYRMRAIFEPALDWKNWRTPAQRRISLYTDKDRAEAKRIEAEAVKIDKKKAAKEKEFIERTFVKELEKLDEALREPIRAARNTPKEKRSDQQKRLLGEHPSVNVSAGSLYLYDKKAADELKAMGKEAAEIRKKKPKEDFIRALTEVAGKVPQTYLFDRGNHDQPKQKVDPGELSVLVAAGKPGAKPGVKPARNPKRPTTGRRLAYARQLTDPSHPLTARVLVNRIWSHHFGRGIVATPGDFGFLGMRPTHPQLLDWLAADFVANGWRIKRLHKLIMTSTVYRQSSRRDPEKDRIDADNYWLWRMPVRRMEAETLRDAILAVSGKLNTQMFGPAVPVMEDGVGQIVIGKENKDGEGKPGKIVAMNGQEFRRSIYVQVRRSRTLAMLESFDAPAMTPNCVERSSSTVAPQALMLMNGQFVLDQAQAIGQRVVREVAEADKTAATGQTSGGSDGGIKARQARHAWRLVYGSTPTDQQVKTAVRFMNEQARTFEQARDKKKPAEPDKIKLAALASYCHALISANRFLYVD